jgi:hypothetical protein
MLQRFLSLLSPLDWGALVLFLCGWFGYSYIADRAKRSAKGRAVSPICVGSSGRGR